MSFLENDTFLFWENDAVSEIGTVLEIIPRLQNWATWPAQTQRMAPITWACPVNVLMGPVTRARGLLAMAPFTGPYPVSGRTGPIRFGPSIGF